jgi:hypothetical protein
MCIPQKVSKLDLIDALKRNRQGLDKFEEKLDLGHVTNEDLEDLAMSAGRIKYLCRELIHWRIFQIHMKAAAKQADLDLEWES